ncbi:hypothetical protein B0H21DRAFT_765049 [Amylocystis lapponica]|nr:hypothetical protein B0H21DRAFT_765049 [Amylocystis lapponica]
MSNTQTSTRTDTGHPEKPLTLSVRASTLPLQPTGALDKFEFIESTPVIGREYKNVQLSDLLKADNSDELIRELAIIISQRNVVFFRNQDINIEQQKLVPWQQLGILSGRPKESGLHIHPTTRPSSELGLEITVITSQNDRSKIYEDALDISQFASREWHTDGHTLPPLGGDTLWASSYEAYDRLSPSFAKFLEGLTAVHDARPTGNPENIGLDLTAIHPVIRTNPVTGWKGLFVSKSFTRRILELTKDESDFVLDYLNRVITENHDLQVRFNWKQNDVAIWANSSTVHNVTRDYDEHREGNRVVSLGERPYFDPASQSRREALGLKKRVFWGQA